MWISLILACQDTPKNTPTVDAVPTTIQQTKEPQVPHTPSPDAQKSRFDADPKLTPLDVVRFATQEIPFLRNEVFARHGRAFKTPKYVEHFTKTSWYKVDPNYNDTRLTQNDKANIDLLRSFEQTSAPKDFVAMGEFFYNGNGNYEESRIILPIDERTLAIHEGSDMYYNSPKNVSYTLQGDWLITYTGTLNRKKNGYTVWKVDMKNGKITEKHEQKNSM